MFKVDRKMYKVIRKCIKSIKVHALNFLILLIQIYHSYSKAICFSFRHTFFSLLRENFHMKDVIQIPP